MNTFSLASSNDDVREGSTVLENEHGILLAGLRLPLAHIACGRFVSFSDGACRLAPVCRAVPDRSYRFMPPSKLPLTGIAAAEVTAPAEAGSVVVRPVGVARLSRTAFTVLVAKRVMPSMISS